MTPDPATVLRGPTAAEVLAHFAGSAFGAEERAYIAYHALRYSYLLGRMAEALRDAGAGGGGGGAVILDVAPLFEVDVVRAFFPAARVDTVGFANAAFPSREGDRHAEFDLNDAVDPTAWPVAGPADVAIMGEVIEHLHVPAAKVLACVASWVRPGGHLLLQTPNAVALHKRVRMLAGRSPFEPIRESEQNPGHFHEFTANELAGEARAAGWRTVAVETVNYFEHPSLAGRLYTRAGRWLPVSLRHGLTLAARR